MRPHAILAAAALGAAGCYPCDLEIHGACVSYQEPTLPVEAEAYWTAAVERSTDFWGTDLRGWTIVVHDHPVRCYGIGGRAGCTHGELQQIHLYAPETCHTLWLAHEVGHVAHPLDAGHWSRGWATAREQRRPLGACELQSAAPITPP